MVVATAVMEEWELRPIDVEQAFLQADVDEDYLRTTKSSRERSGG